MTTKYLILKSSTPQEKVDNDNKIALLTGKRDAQNKWVAGTTSYSYYIDHESDGTSLYVLDFDFHNAVAKMTSEQSLEYKSIANFAGADDDTLYTQDEIKVQDIGFFKEEIEE